MKFYIPPQLTRLAIAFAIFISLFLLVRAMLIPETFGEYGHYRGDALEDNAGFEAHFTGQTVCLDCHQDIEDKKLTDVHSEIRCEACHGPGYKHIEKGDTSLIVKPAGREFCGKCHSKNAARRRDAVFQIDIKSHNAGKDCTECHNPHQPWEMKK